MTELPRTASRAAKLLISLLVLATGVVAAVWFVAARQDHARSAISETSPTAAIDGFVRAYNDGDTAVLEDRVCRDRRALVTFAIADNRRTFTTLRRSGPLRTAVEDRLLSVTVHLDAGGPNGARGDPLLGVQPRAGEGRWCVSSLSGTVRTLSR